MMGAPKKTQAPATATETTTAPTPPLKAVPERSPTQVAWEVRDRELRAKRLGVSPAELAESEDLTEDWQLDAVTEREKAGPEFAGLYHLKHGHLGVPRLGPAPILAGRKVRLTADEGRCATESGVGVRLGD